MSLHLDGSAPPLSAWRALWSGDTTVTVCADARRRAAASAQAVAAIVARGDAAYGINTGFGKLASQRIGDADLSRLQENLIRSHAVGLGAPLASGVVRLVLAQKLGSLLRGLSGVRDEVLVLLHDLLRHDILPVIPSQGSVGASGDLAPLSHLTLVLMGEGEATVGGEVLPGAAALARFGLSPVSLGPKEGLALINGTQVSTALALHGLFLTERVFAAAVAAGALTTDAARGSDAPFDPRIHDARGQVGQIAVAARYRALLANSAIRASHLLGDERVQDPYSLRCQPQVMGACLDHLRHVAGILAIEAHAVSDNPLLLPGEGGWDVLSGGNFHAEPVALAADELALVLAEIGALSERRMALLIDASISRLPPFLVRDPGLNSGFMIAHVTAAALASENKSLAHPASVDSLPTSANQEDHVSMATFAARRLADMASNTAGIIGIELLAAAQGVDLLRPLATSTALEDVHTKLRAIAAPYDGDRYLGPELAAAQRLVLGGSFVDVARDLLPSWSAS